MSSPQRRKPRTTRKSSAPTKNASQARTSKLDAIVSALRSPKGASISDLMRLTGWQQHSVRGALAGALKKGRGLAITSAKVSEERIYKLDAKK